MMNMLCRLDATGYPLLLARLIVGLIFLMYGIEKVSDPIAFLKSIKNYDLLPLEPSWFINSIAVILPFTEIVCALALLSGIGLRSAAAVTSVMLLAFTPAVYLLGSSLVGTTPEFDTLCNVVADCGCGSGAIPICQKLLENCGLILLSLWATFSGSSKFRGGLGGGDS